MKRFIRVTGLASAGLIILAAGFAYDLAFAGLPYQDVSPEIQARWDFHHAVAGRIYLSGGIVFLLGVIGIPFLWLKTGKPKCQDTLSAADRQFLRLDAATIARAFILLSWLIGNAYARDEIMSHTDGPGSGFAQVFWVTIWLPSTAVALLPAFMLCGKLSSRPRWWMLIAALILPLLGIGYALVQYRDMPGLAALLLTILPAMAVVGWLTLRSRSAISRLS